MIRSLSAITLSLITFSSLNAATVVEIQDAHDMTTVMTDGEMARMDMPGTEYVVVEMKANKIKYVSPQDKEVMLIDANKIPSGSEAQNPVVRLSKLGPGPTIAGYDTEKFSLTANDQQCAVVYGSDDAAGAEGISELLSVMQTMAEKQRSMMGGFAGMVDDCTRAEMNIADHVKTVGVPMRVEKNGKKVSEVKSIKVSVDLPKDTFAIPADYKTVTMQQKMAAAQQQMQQYKQQYQPQMQDMMRQMQQSGQMTPEMMERMRQAEQMMQQYQQR